MERPMKWYKFVVYVQLFLVAILSVANAVIYCGGLYYSSRTLAEQVYASYGVVKWADIFMGICSFACAVLAIIAWQKLRNYKTDGPKWYIGLLVLELIVEITYMIRECVLVGGATPDLDARTVVQIALYVFLIVANKKYFDNRADLFVN